MKKLNVVLSVAVLGMAIFLIINATTVESKPADVNAVESVHISK